MVVKSDVSGIMKKCVQCMDGWLPVTLKTVSKRCEVGLELDYGRLKSFKSTKYKKLGNLEIH